MTRVRYGTSFRDRVGDSGSIVRIVHDSCTVTTRFVIHYKHITNRFTARY